MENNPCLKIRALSSVQIAILSRTTQIQFDPHSIQSFTFLFFELRKKSNIHMKLQEMLNRQSCKSVLLH